MEDVIYVGLDRKFKYPYNKGLRNSKGLIQLNGNQEWRLPAEFKNPFCYGWHDLGKDWEKA